MLASKYGSHAYDQCAVPRCSRGSGSRNCQKSFASDTGKPHGAYERHFLGATASHRAVHIVSRKLSVLEIDCYTVRKELSDYVEGALAPELTFRIEHHLEKCGHCTAVYDGIWNVVQLIADERAIKLPNGFSGRLHKRLLRIQ